MAKKNDYVTIHSVVLESAARASAVPDDTHKVPLEMWVKGFLTEAADIGDTATVITRTGRNVTGKVCDESPHYTHSFGNLIPELLVIGDTVKKIVFGGAQ
ncbi:MAG: 2-amino-4-oxopentanoate thiolase subunit OrtA [Clostridia bacterium]